VRIVLAPRCNVPLEARIFKAERPHVWIVCGDSSKCGHLFGRRGVRIFDIGASSSGILNLRLAMMRLAAEGVTRLLVEGGPTTSRGFIEAGLADEIVIMQGNGTLEANASMPPFADKGLDIVTASPAFVPAALRKAGTDTIFFYRSTSHWRN
jgi:diaminohydroxyphosphoribosylaminopyrimidine deaminase/5-amino-6-(5-phosphoribosylamino)uracil reductase